MGRDEGGQLLIVAGIVLTLAFAATAITLGQVADLEKQVAREQAAPILTDYRFLREKMGSILRDSMTPTTSNATFLSLFSTAQSQIKGLAFDSGYDAVVRLADDKYNLAMSEWSFTDLGYPHNTTRSPLPETGNARSAHYFLRSSDDRLIWETYYSAQGGKRVWYDKGNDGILWVNALSSPDTTGCVVSPGTACIQGAIVYYYLSDGATTIEEFVVYAFNS